MIGTAVLSLVNRVPRPHPALISNFGGEPVNKVRMD